MLADHIGIPQIRDMASRSEQIEGEIGLQDLPRLTSLLHPDTQTSGSHLNVELGFQRGPYGFPEISGLASGSIDLSCQRCLGPLEWPLDLRFKLAIVESDEDTEEFAEPFDTVVAGEHGVALAATVEDELLGSLPLAPMHEDLADCCTTDIVGYNQTDLSAGNGSSSDQKSDTDTNRPFAELAQLLKSSADADKE